MDDLAHMRAALGLARRGLGSTWPNPSVGCVLVNAGRVVGRGVTAPGGRPHAEAVALAMAGQAARGAVAYVTLEPCSHWGQTPPCANALVEAGVARVVVAIGDPDARVNGAGMAHLREAGLAVATGVLEDEARELLAGFASRVRRGRPLVTLKLATTLDGRIATRGGASQWITAERARRLGHALRGRHDAILVGVGTVLADDPALTCRLAGYRSRELVRVVADSHLRSGLSSTLVVTARQSPTWMLHREGADPNRREALEELGVRLMEVSGGEMGIDLHAGLRELANAGITRLLVEGGGRVAASLLRARLVDRLAWFHAPSVMGGDGWPAASAFGVQELADMPRFTRLGAEPIGEDMLSTYAAQETA